MSEGYVFLVMLMEKMLFFSFIFDPGTSDKIVAESVNYHFTRRCNYKCGFCFHTARTSYILPIEQAEKGLYLLKQSGLKKLNFSGGEPFLEPKFMGLLAKYCKLELNLESVSIVSNGSKITKKWMETFDEYSDGCNSSNVLGEYIDILAISCDSFDDETNHQIGRCQTSRTKHVEKLIEIKNWCDDYGIGFKINTVVNTENLNEDFTENIECLNPIRWKVFQCLLLDGENVGADALRNAERFYITDEQFDEFVRRHSHVKCIVPESNEKMKDSYLILDEYMRFLNCRDGKKIPSHSILDVGVEAAINHSGFDEEMFKKRGGKYKWNRESLEW